MKRDLSTPTQSAANISAPIIAIALQHLMSKGGVTIETLIDVIHATPNPTVAAELLLNVYQTPHIETSEKPFESKSACDINFLSYDKYTDNVTYKYLCKRTREAWFKKGEKSPTVANIASKCTWSEDAAEELRLSKTDFTEQYERLTYETLVDTCYSESAVERERWNDMVQNAFAMTA